MAKEVTIKAARARLRDEMERHERRARHAPKRSDRKNGQEMVTYLKALELMIFGNELVDA